MQFVTSKINTGKSATFDELCQGILDKRNVKTASTDEANVKTAEEYPSSGQLDVEPLHQKGESTNQPGGSGKSSKGDDEAESSGQPEAEAKLVNDPKKVEEAEASTEVKEAEAKEEEVEEAAAEKTCECEGECTCDKGDEKCEEEKDCATASSQQFVKVANLDEKTKGFLRDFWGKIYPADFVDAMLAEK
jgi:hypothetical protein